MQTLTVCLLYEVGKGKKSWWYPYLKNLPRSYSTLPTFRQFEVQAFQVQLIYLHLQLQFLVSFV